MTISSPLKLDTTYNPVNLFNFNGDMLDEGFANVLMSNGGGGNETYSTGHEHGTKAYFFRSPSIRIQASVPNTPASVRVLGDITVQAVARWGEFTPLGTLMACEGNSGTAEINNIAWQLSILNTAGQMSPQFAWQHDLGVAVVVQDTTFTLTENRWYHIVGRRTSDGAGTSTAELFVNGCLIAKLTGQTDATGSSNSYLHLSTRNEGDTGLPAATSISSAKMVDRALTDDELFLEFERVREAIR